MITETLIVLNQIHFPECKFVSQLGEGAGILAALGARLLVRCLSSEAIFAFISRRETMASTIP
mgnify:CR=1 FL=1